jgi:hypothetical protein
METPTPKELVEALGISSSYASMILSDGPHKRVPPPGLAAAIFIRFGVKLGIFEGQSDDDAHVLARVHGEKAA